MAFSLARRISTGYAVGLVLVAGIAAAGLWSARRARDDAAWVMHSYQVLDTLDVTVTRVRGLGTATWAFVLTSNDHFMVPYRTADADIRRSLTVLHRLTVDNPRQQALLVSLDGLVDRELTGLGDELAARRRGATAHSLEPQVLENNVLMDRIRGLVSVMRGEERSLLADRMATAGESAFRADVMIALGVLLSISFTLASYWGIMRELAARTRATAALRTAEAQARRSARDLAHSNAELQQFASVASHDLQEPLRKIRAFGDRIRGLAGDALPAEARDGLEHMSRAAARMQVLIDDLLAYARVSATAAPFVRVDLDLIVREVIADLEHRLDTSGGEIVVGSLPALDADPTQMRQLLQNLIANALKFHRPGVPPVVTVRGARVESADGMMCTIVVADNGIGMDESSLQRIFVPFQRLHGRGEYEGTGMGLAICRKIADRHGGAVTVASTPGHGSIFTVSIPIEIRPLSGGLEADRGTPPPAAPVGHSLAA